MQLYVAYLYVEDEEYLAEAVKRSLISCGHEVMLASDGKEGLDCIRNGRFDLIFLDLFMPVVDGFEVLKVMGDEGLIEKQPVVVLTNDGNEHDKKRILELGARGHAIKADLDLADIVGMVDEYIS